MPRAVPCHLIAGPLGVGKTTAILNYLKQNAGREFVAVLTNDFGAVGLDSVILEGATGGAPVKLVNVPGGCICCTALHALDRGLEQIAQLPGVARVIVEPSGLTMLNQLCPAIEKLCERVGFEWRPVIVLVDPGRLKMKHIESLPYFEQLIQRAEILVANRCDRSSPEAMADFREWSAAWQPPKLKVLTTTHGRLAREIFELKRTGTVAWQKVEAHDPESHPHAAGNTWSADRIFSHAALVRSLEADGIQRFKGIFHTDDGWRLIEWASGEIHDRPVSPSDASRAEWILDRTVDAASFAKIIQPTP